MSDDAAAARWRHMQDIFFAAEALEPGERKSFVGKACHGDETLRREIEALLEADGHASQAIGEQIELQASRLADDEGSRLIGTSTGRYRLSGVLGRGGMGVVFLATREDGLYGKPVALKLIKRGMDTDEVIRRFAQERSILSRLDHPYIARLLDGGTTTDGLPYFVMERIEGESITAFCYRLPLRARLDLFRQVCSAVDYANRRLVVHRDLKPANILVTPDGAPKLLDFGIAKVLTAEDSSQTAAGGWRVLTPQYASPEQKRGEEVGIATDVYSLGVVLDEIAGHAGAPAELALISRKARHEEPERRYASVAALSDDLLRFLQGRPVAARSDTAAYRFQKFVGRNKLLVAVSLLALASILSAAVISTRQARQLRHESEQVRKLATAMLFEMNDEIRLLPGSVKARERLVRTGLRFLDETAARSGTDPKLQWELARAYERIANLQGGPQEVQANLGDIDGARASHLVALRLTSSLLQRDPGSERLRSFQAALHDNIARLSVDPKESFHHLGESLRISTGLQDANGIEQARLGIALAHLAAGDPRAAVAQLPRRTVAHTWETKVVVWKAAGALETALSIAREGLEIAESSLASARDAPSRRFAQGAAARAHAEIGEILGDPCSMNLGDRAGAIRELRIAAKLAEENAALEPDDVIRSDLGSILVRLASVLAATAPRESVQICQRAIVAGGRFRKRDLLRREWPDVLTAAHYRIAVPLIGLRQYEEAARHLAESVQLQDTTAARNIWGDLRLALGDREGAARQYRIGLAIARQQVSEKPGMMPMYAQLADSIERLARLGVPPQDEDWWRQSVWLWRDWRMHGEGSGFNTRREREAAAAWQLAVRKKSSNP